MITLAMPTVLLVVAGIATYLVVVLVLAAALGAFTIPRAPKPPAPFSPRLRSVEPPEEE